MQLRIESGLEVAGERPMTTIVVLAIAIVVEVEVEVVVEAEAEIVDETLSSLRCPCTPPPLPLPTHPDRTLPTGEDSRRRARAVQRFDPVVRDVRLPPERQLPVLGGLCG